MRCRTPKRTDCVEQNAMSIVRLELDTRAGHYERQLHTKAGDVTVKMDRAGRSRAH
jgi:hypothetical protein